MAYRYRRFLVVATLTLLVAIGMALAGVGPLRRIAWAALHAPDRLPAFAADPRIRYEAGAEDLARSIAMGLPGAVATIESVQGRPFKRVSVYAFGSSDSFTADGAAGGRERGVSWGGRTFIGPRVLEQPDTIALLVAHELSHAHLQQWMNMLDFARLPSWFREGLATYASGGGGAETVSDDEARQAIRWTSHQPGFVRLAARSTRHR